MINFKHLIVSYSPSWENKNVICTKITTIFITEKKEKTIINLLQKNIYIWKDVYNWNVTFHLELYKDKIKENLV